MKYYLIAVYFMVTCGQVFAANTKQPPDNNNIWKRPNLTGNWGSTRTGLSNKGITFYLDLTQIMQGNLHGGIKNGVTYAGSAAYFFIFDFEKMNFWNGASIMLGVDTQFGRSSNNNAGASIAVNADALFPIPDSGVTALTTAIYTQSFSGKIQIELGLIHPVIDSNDFAYLPLPFLNAGFAYNQVFNISFQYSLLGLHIYYHPIESLFIKFWALGLDGTSEPALGFFTAFKQPKAVTLLNEWNITIKPYGLTGHQRLGALWSTKEFNILAQDPKLQVGVDIVTGATQHGDWAIYYNFDQYLYVESDDPTQGIGLFGRFGLTSGIVNPCERFYDFGLNGKGIIPGRNKDTLGVGYYYSDLSDDIPININEHGMELFYRVEIIPSIYVTLDIQVIVDPTGDENSRKDIVVLGLRSIIYF